MLTELRSITANMKWIVIYVLLPLLCETAVEVLREYIYISQALDWPAAQKYCQEKYLDLATVSTEEEHQRLIESGGQGWIGMNRTEPKATTWQWSDGEPAKFFKWLPKQPDNYNNTENCVHVFSSGWNDNTCFDTLNFYCERKIIMVKENKTWHEAFDFCKRNYTELLCPSSTTKLALVLKENQTVSVWTGLRFMNQKWFWVNGQQDNSLASLPSCPAPHYSCGAPDFKNKVWQNRDCNEKLYFLCY